MPETAPNTELLRSLARLARGLSTLFWSLPTSLIVCAQTVRADWLKSLGILPPLVTTSLLVYGLWQMGHFQKQERVWRKALDRALFLGLVNAGLSPFLYWWSKVPTQPFFSAVVFLLGATGLLFLNHLNVVLQRLSAMLPDEALRQETKQFTTVNRILLLLALLLAVLYLLLSRWPNPLPAPAVIGLSLLDRGSLALLIVLLILPLAVTMALVWKTKEVILESLFEMPR